mmetsp:Transcript_17649/g.51371  ORF Transcript_17649/g.51371 Transcript_17649/m.51371 type:complete len:99 (+) Transcript_17649:107-403(+)
MIVVLSKVFPLTNLFLTNSHSQLFVAYEDSICQTRLTTEKTQMGTFALCNMYESFCERQVSQYTSLRAIHFLSSKHRLSHENSFSITNAALSSSNMSP